MMAGSVALRVILRPGNMACVLIGAESEDDQSTIRTLVNMLAWIFVVVVVLWKLWRWL